MAIITFLIIGVKGARAFLKPRVPIDVTVAHPKQSFFKPKPLIVIPRLYVKKDVTWMRRPIRLILYIIIYNGGKYCNKPDLYLCSSSFPYFASFALPLIYSAISSKDFLSASYTKSDAKSSPSPILTRQDMSTVGNSTNFPNAILPHIFFLLTLTHSAIALMHTWVNVTCESLKEYNYISYFAYLD